MKNIFLIGMMGSGKSTTGKLLSKKLSLPLIDMDDDIQQLMDMSISKIFNDYGEERFRLIESAFFKECSKNDDFIYSTGGGIVIDSKNQNILQKRGLCFFLDCDTETIISRLKDKEEKRPLYKTNEDIISIYNDRIDLYKKCAHYTIDINQLDPNAIVQKIEKIYNANN